MVAKPIVWMGLEGCGDPPLYTSLDGVWMGVWGPYPKLSGGCWRPFWRGGVQTFLEGVSRLVWRPPLLEGAPLHSRRG